MEVVSPTTEKPQMRLSGREWDALSLLLMNHVVVPILLWYFPLGCYTYTAPLYQHYLQCLPKFEVEYAVEHMITKKDFFPFNKLLLEADWLFSEERCQEDHALYL